VPRRISLKFLESEDGSGPWSRYLATPDSEKSKPRGKEFKFLSDSMVQLLQLCSDVIGVKPRKLLLRVKYVEWTIIFSAQVPVAQEQPSPSSTKVAGESSCRSSDSEEEQLSDDGSDSSFSCCCSDCSHSSTGSSHSSAGSSHSGSECSESDSFYSE